MTYPTKKEAKARAKAQLAHPTIPKPLASPPPAAPTSPSKPATEQAVRAIFAAAQAPAVVELDPGAFGDDEFSDQAVPLAEE